MKRKELLEKLGYEFPEQYAKKVIICTDAHNEADDQFAIVHHLLTPCEDVLGIVACHYEYMTRMITARAREMAWDEEYLKNHLERLHFAPLHGSVDLSLQEVHTVLERMGVNDMPVLRGAADPLPAEGRPPASAGADFIIERARALQSGKIYVCCLGGLTDAAIALQKAPDIAPRIVVIWIGGGTYPDGGEEFNLMQDVAAANVVFASRAEVWQIPKSSYTKVVVSFSELMARVRPCGEIGRYLVDNLLRFHRDIALGCNSQPLHRDAWILGDNPTVSVLAVEDFGEAYHMARAPHIESDYSYTPDPQGKPIRVYDRVHERFILEDFIAKLQLVTRTGC